MSSTAPEAPNKIDAGTMTITAERFAELCADARTRVDQGNVHGECYVWGVVVSLVAPHHLGHTIEVEMCETEEYARRTLAPFNAFYNSTARVHVLHVV